MRMRCPHLLRNCLDLRLYGQVKVVQVLEVGVLALTCGRHGTGQVHGTSAAQRMVAAQHRGLSACMMKETYRSGSGLG